MSYLCTAIEKSSMRPDGGIGRRAGLKHQWIHFHPGSTPGLGTEAEKVEILSPLFFFTPRNSLVIPKFALIFIVRVVGDGYFYFCVVDSG